MEPLLEHVMILINLTQKYILQANKMKKKKYQKKKRTYQVFKTSWNNKLPLEIYILKKKKSNKTMIRHLGRLFNGKKIVKEKVQYCYSFD